MFGAGGLALGYWARGKFDNLQLPKLRASGGVGSETCRLVVRIHEASVPGLAAPGLVTSTRPRLEITLGSATKTTELADFGGGEWAWRFGDTLTFTTSHAEVMAGLTLRLCSHSEAHFGPISLEYQNIKCIAEAKLDLRHRVLPAFTLSRSSWNGGDSAPRWVSPRLPVPLLTPQGQAVAPEALAAAVGMQSPRLTAHAAQVTLAFELSVDPEELLAVAEGREQPLTEKLKRATLDPVSEQVERVSSNTVDPVRRWMAEPVDETAFGFAGWAATPARSSCHQRRTPGAGELLSPDEQPESWVKHTTPDGRELWHHLSLGPPPWETAPSLSNTNSQSLAPSSSSDAKRLPSPEEQPDGWIKHCSPDGREFWHHRDLGPAPWEMPGADPTATSMERWNVASSAIPLSHDLADVEEYEPPRIAPADMRGSSQEETQPKKNYYSR